MNVYELMATLSLDTGDYEKKLNEAESGAERSGSGIGSKLMSIGKTAGKVLATSTAVVASGVSAVTAMAVKGYASYEQLAGGVEKLFGADVAKAVTENAQKAFMTSGKNINDYMESVTSFSASLIKSVGGDTEKAAAQADKALTDMADNVNTFGSSIESVENAYKGFAKQNFTMLDNLNLGFAGSKEGMQELLNSAEEISGIKYDISSYSDIVDAIHVVQESMNIAGTTSREAAGTIEGSFNMTKAAVQNLVHSLGNSDADIGQLVSDVITSAGSLASNVIPRVQEVFSGLGSAIEKAAPNVISAIPTLFAEIVPGLLESTFSLVETVGGAIVEGIPNLINTVGENINSNAGNLISIAVVLLGQLVNAFATYAPQFVDVATQYITSFSKGFVNGIPNLLSKVLPMILSLSQTIRTNAGQLISAGLVMIMNLADGIINSIPLLIQYVPEIITNFCGIINDNAPKVLATGIAIITHLVTGIVKAVPVLIANIPKIIQSIISIFMAFNWINLGSSIIKAIANGVKSLASSLPNALRSIAKSASSGFKSFNWSNIGSSVIRAIVTGVKSLASAVPGALRSIGSTALSVFKSISWSSLGSNIISGIVSGISGAAGRLFSSLRNLASNALSAAKQKLGIHSPSRVFRDQVGKQIAAGIALGIDDNAPIRSMYKLTDSLRSQALGVGPFSTTKNGLSGGNKTSYFNVNMNVNGAEDPEEWGEKFVKALERQERMGYA